MPTKTTKIEQQKLFQAIGIVLGQVFLEENQLKIDLKGNIFSLKPNLGKRQIFDALRKDVTAHGNRDYLLRVYPQITHFPKKDEPYDFYFCPIQFQPFQSSQAQSERISEPVNTFKLAGIWQFIAPCRTPVISVYRNKTEQLSNYLKQQENPFVLKKMTRANHLPLMWRDAPVKPFRFNPKAEEQGDRYFVELVATFDPRGKRFFYKESIAEPTIEIPYFKKPFKPTNTSK